MMSSAGRRVGTLAAVSLLIVVLTGAAAQAVTWGTIRAYYNGIARSEARGNFFNESGLNARNDYWLNDVSNDGNNSYGHTRFYFYYGGAYHYATQKNTGEYTWANTPVTKILRAPLDQMGERARGNSRVCVQLGFPVPDSCSNYAVVSFGY
jgi:hypothetical protein